MSQHKHAIFTRPNGEAIDRDRCTVVIMAHYQEFDSPTTHIRFAYDRTQPVEDKPYQGTMRVDLSPTEIDIGRLKWGDCEVILGHQLARISQSSEIADILQEAQKSNRIELLDADLKTIGWIMPDRACAMHFSGPVFARSTKATAILHITALPATQ
jgi:hypothetical protein